MGKMGRMGRTGRTGRMAKMAQPSTAVCKGVMAAMAETGVMAGKEVMAGTGVMAAHLITPRAEPAEKVEMPVPPEGGRDCLGSVEHPVDYDVHHNIAGRGSLNRHSALTTCRGGYPRPSPVPYSLSVGIKRLRVRVDGVHTALAIASPISALAVIPCTKGRSCINQGNAANAIRPRALSGESSV